MEFNNEYKNTRSGFSHTSELISSNGEVIGFDKRNYINRTWEVYPFQSSMRGAVQDAINREIDKQKHLQGIVRLTAKKKEEIIAYSSIINQLKTLYKSL